MSATYSLILVTCDHLELTVRCLQSLGRSMSDEVELVVVDNGSTDGTRAYLEAALDQLPGRAEALLLDRNQGWCRAANAGLERANGDYLVLLNNDLVFPSSWIEGLRECMDSAQQVSPGFGPAGLVGPVSNSVGGSQQVPTPGGYGPRDVERVARTLAQQHAAAWRPSNFLSGFCLMISRACYQQIGGLDEAYWPGGFDDNDLVLRAQERGFCCYVAGNVFVHHQGSATFNDLFPHKRGGLANLQLFQQRWQQRRQGPGRLVAIYRVKDAARTLGQSLAATAGFADAICVLDDGSTDSTPELCQEHPAVTRYERHERPFDERRDRNRLLELAAELEPDWVIAVDGDEVFELDRARAQRLMHLADPHLRALGFHWYTFWDEEHRAFRADGIFGRMSGLRMYRWEPNQRIEQGTAQGLHCGNIPRFPPGAASYTDVRVRHLGYDTPPLRRAKYELYRALDPDPDPALVGNADYSHLISPTVSLREYAAEHGVSLCLITRDEEQRLPGMLAFWEPFVDQICVVDTGSTDGTVDVARRFTEHVEQLEADPQELDLGQARNRSLELATQPWVLCLDPDEELWADDLPRLQRLLDDPQCLAYSFEVLNLQKDVAPVVTVAVRLFRNDPRVRFSRPVHETVEQSLRRIPDAVVRPSGISIRHLGFLKEDQQVQRKLDAYYQRNRRYMEQQPDDPMPYYNEALHQLNEGQEEEAERLLVQTLERDPAFLSPRAQLAYILQQRAMRLWRAVLHQSAPDHPLATEARRALDGLAAATPRRPLVGAARLRGEQE